MLRALASYLPSLQLPILPRVPTTQDGPAAESSAEQSKINKRGFIFIHGPPGDTDGERSSMRGFEDLGTRLNELDCPFARTGGGWYGIRHQGVRHAVSKMEQAGCDAVTVFVTGHVLSNSKTETGSQGRGAGSDNEEGQYEGSGGYCVLLADEPDLYHDGRDTLLSGNEQASSDGKTWLSIQGLLRHLSNAGLSNADIVLCPNNAASLLDCTDETAHQRITCLTGPTGKYHPDIYHKLAQRLMREIRGSDDDASDTSSDTGDEDEENVDTLRNDYLNSLDGQKVRDEYDLVRVSSLHWPEQTWPRERFDLAPYRDFTRRLDSLLDGRDGSFPQSTRDQAKRVMSTDNIDNMSMSGREVDLLMSAIQTQMRGRPDRVRGEVEGVKRYWHYDDTTLGPGTYLINALHKATQPEDRRGAEITE